MTSAGDEEDPADKLKSKRSGDLFESDFPSEGAAVPKVRKPTSNATASLTGGVISVDPLAMAVHEEVVMCV